MPTIFVAINQTNGYNSCQRIPLELVMSQHFLLSAKARTLCLTGIMRMTDDEAHAPFQAIRWADNGGEPFCPRCQCQIVYAMTTHRRWKCKECRHQFSVTSGT